MSQVIFNSWIDLKNIGITPSGIGYTIAYDNDGVLKQKDQDGVITPVSSTANLEDTLAIGNYSGTYSIKMGTGSTIHSINGTGNIKLDNGGTSSVNISVTGSNINNYINTSFDGIHAYSEINTNVGILQISSKTFSTHIGTTTYSTFIENLGNKITIGHNDTTIGSGGKINVFESGKTYDGIDSLNKAYVHINTYGASTSHGVKNSVIIGGSWLTASRSDTVYLGNSVNINNMYTLPNTDGLNNQVLTTNGSGTASWTTFTINTPSLSDVLSVGNYSGPNDIIMHTNQNIILGTGSSITSMKSTSNIKLDYTDSKVLIGSDSSVTTGVIILGTNSLYTQANVYELQIQTGSVTTQDLQGLKYTDDYTATFVTHSLVTKKYVDTYGGGYQTHLIAYVDPNKGNDAIAQINKPFLPYQTISAAMAAMLLSSYSISDRGLIHLRKGNYTTTAPLRNNIDYYCEPDVIFTSGGFEDLNGVANSNIYGYVSFISTDVVAPALKINNASTVNLYFDTIDTKQVAANINGGNISMYGRYVKTLSSSQYGFNIAGSTNFNLRVKEGIIGAYDVIKFSDSYSGKAFIDSPYIIANASIGLNGVVLNTVHAVRVGSSVTGTIRINSNIEEISLSTSGNNSAVLVSSGNLFIKGEVRGNNSYGIYLPNGGSGRVNIDGDVTSIKEAIYNMNDNIELKIENSIIKSDGLGSFTQSVYMGASGSIYINNSTIYNGLTNSSLIRVEREESSIYIYNSMAYSPGTNGYLLSCTYSDYVMGMHNLRSNKDNADNIIDLFDPSGFIYDSLLYVPTF